MDDDEKDDRIEELEDENEELREDIRGLQGRLRSAADLAVAAGLCHDTPHSRREWAEGRGWPS